MEKVLISLSLWIALGLTVARAEYRYHGETHIDRELQILDHPVAFSEDLDRLYSFWPEDEFESRYEEAVKFFEAIRRNRPPLPPVTFRHELTAAAYPIFSLIGASPYGKELLRAFIPQYLDKKIPCFPLASLEVLTPQGFRPTFPRVQWWGHKGVNALLLGPQNELGILVYQMTWAIHLSMDPVLEKAHDDIQIIADRYEKLLSRFLPRILPEDGDLIVSLSAGPDASAFYQLQALARKLDNKRREITVLSNRAAYDAAHRVVNELAERSPVAQDYYRSVERRRTMQTLTPVSAEQLGLLLGMLLPPELLLEPGCIRLIGELGEESNSSSE